MAGLQHSVMNSSGKRKIHLKLEVEALLTQSLTREAMSSGGTFSDTLGGTGGAGNATDAAAAGSLSTLDGTLLEET